MSFPQDSNLRVVLENGDTFDLGSNQVVLTRNGYKRDTLLGQYVQITGEPISGSGMTVNEVIYYYKVISVTDLDDVQIVSGTVITTGSETLQDPNQPSFAVY